MHIILLTKIKNLIKYRNIYINGFLKTTINSQDSYTIGKQNDSDNSDNITKHNVNILCDNYQFIFTDKFPEKNYYDLFINGNLHLIDGYVWIGYKNTLKKPTSTIGKYNSNINNIYCENIYIYNDINLVIPNF